MNGLANRLANELANGLVNGLANELVNGLANGLGNELVTELVNGLNQSFKYPGTLQTQKRILNTCSPRQKHLEKPSSYSKKLLLLVKKSRHLGFTI